MAHTGTRILLAALLAASTATAAPASRGPTAVADVAFVDVTVVPMDREAVLAHQPVLVDAHVHAWREDPRQ